MTSGVLKVKLLVHGREPHARKHFHVRCGSQWSVSYAVDTFERDGFFLELARRGRPNDVDLAEALRTAENVIAEILAEWEKCNARD